MKLSSIAAFLSVGQCGIVNNIIQILRGDVEISQSETRNLVEKAQTEYGIQGAINDDVLDAWDIVLSTVKDGYKKINSHFEAVKRPNNHPGNNRQPLNNNDEFVHIQDERYPGFGLRIKEPQVGIDNVTQYSGYFDVAGADKHFFFWFFESRSDPENDPTVMWLNGGPGCSSMMGLFFELGPASIGADLEPQYNPWSWNTKANIFFLDQPIGTGLSYGDDEVYTTEDAAKDNYVFLQMFFNKFPQYAKNGFHIAGESYAGHYVPAFANHHRVQEDRSFDVASALIGNGLTDPLRQYNQFEPMGCGLGGHKAIFNETQCAEMHKAAPKCDEMIQKCYDTKSQLICAPATVYCNNHLMINPFSSTGLNIYDIRRKCEGDNGLCYPTIQYTDDFLNRPDVQKEIGVNRLFNDCNTGVGYGFQQSGDWMMPYYRTITELLDHDIPVLVYVGDKDFICNWLGNEAWSRHLEWKGHATFSTRELLPWKSDITGKEAGQIRNHKHFTFLRIYGAGHMVPYDQPEHSMEMFNKWIGGSYGL